MLTVDRSGGRAGRADIVVFNKGGRDFRLEKALKGEAPKEFFYGYFDLEKSALPTEMISSSEAEPGVGGALVNRAEHVFTALTSFGLRPMSARLLLRRVGDRKVFISYTDGFSLSMGFGYPRRSDRPVMMGGFHALSDLEARAPALWRPLVRSLIRRSLAGLDHAFFFGAADRDVSIERYGLDPARTSVIPFGVDTEFWRPSDNASREDFVVAIGQDINRDYDLLAAAPGAHPTWIVTRRKVNVPEGANHVRIATGDFFGSDSMSDQQVRDVYNKACAIVVPLKDVWQPSGYSVTLQAMSCGRPVILTKTRGLWSPNMLVDGENCLLVPPGDAAALGAEIGRAHV